MNKKALTATTYNMELTTSLLTTPTSELYSVMLGTTIKVCHLPQVNQRSYSLIVRDNKVLFAISFVAELILEDAVIQRKKDSNQFSKEERQVFIHWMVLEQLLFSGLFCFTPF